MRVRYRRIAFVLLLMVFSVTVVTEKSLCAEDGFWKNPPQTVVLDNGFTLVYQFDDSSATTVFHMIFKGGAKVQPPGKQGLAFLMTRLMLEVPDSYVFQDLMRLAPKYSMLGKIDYSRINFSCLSEHLEKTLEIIASNVQDPLFTSTRISKVKEEMKYRRLGEEDDPVIVGHRVLVDKLLGDSGYGDAVLGTEESRRQIKRKDILRFYEKYIRANSIILVVSTDLSMEIIRELAETYFSQISSGPEEYQESISFGAPEEKEFNIEKQTTQSLVALGFSLPELTTKNFTLAFLVEMLLGKGVNSRLWDLRAKENLCYNVNSRVTYFKDGGILEAYLETDTPRKEMALKAMRQVFEKLFRSNF